MKKQSQTTIDNYEKIMWLIRTEKTIHIKDFIERHGLSVSQVFFQILRRDKIILLANNIRPVKYKWNKEIIPTNNLAKAVLNEVNKYIVDHTKATIKTKEPVKVNNVTNITLTEALNVLANDNEYTYEIYRTPKNITKERVL